MTSKEEIVKAVEEVSLLRAELPKRIEESDTKAVEEISTKCT